MANASKKKKASKTLPPQQQRRQPGREHEMTPRPEFVRPDYRGSGKLDGKAALITGGDSGIGRATAIAFAKEGADVAIAYYDEDRDARETADMVEAEGRRAILLRGDIAYHSFCRSAVERTATEFGRLDILINNAAMQFPQQSIEDISDEQLDRTFRTNIFSMFYFVKEALPHLRKQGGSCIINTTSVTAYRGSPSLLDYSSTKGAIVSFTRSLSGMLAKDNIRVNGVAPGPIWTPLIPATFTPEKVASFGGDVPLARPGQPDEVAGCFVFLASADASYMTGQVLHPNGGEIING